MNDDERPPISSSTFFYVGTLVEFALVPIAALIGEIHGRTFPFKIDLDTNAFVLGAAATIPPLLYLAFSLSPLGMRFAPLREIHDKVLNFTAPLIRPLNPLHMLIFSLGAGIGEEVLFRGVLQYHWGIGWS
ncbi:MAG: hypothetical protein AAF517_01655, partial [Planctomycetota bacterium]